MQKDIEMIYECIFEESYKDKAALEILVSKVESKEMAIGFMMDLAMKSSMYGIEKEGMPQMIAEYIGEPKTPEYMIGCHKQFVKVMKAKNDSEIATSIFIEKALRLLIFQKTQELDDLLSASSQKNIKNLKEQLLEAEAYEYIAAIDKHIK